MKPEGTEFAEVVKNLPQPELICTHTSGIEKVSHGSYFFILPVFFSHLKGKGSGFLRMEKNCILNGIKGKMTLMEHTYPFNNLPPIGFKFITFINYRLKSYFMG